MEKDERTKVLDRLQQYVPHLEKLIAQLKHSKWKDRGPQLSKLEDLHSVITARKEKLKLDTLRKCENTILKILHKMYPKVFKLEQPKLEPRSSVNMMKLVCKYSSEEHKKISLGESDNFNNLQELKAAKASLSEVDIAPVSPSRSSIEYSLAKMPPIDFYSPTFNQTKQLLLSPPNYANCPPFASENLSPYMDRHRFEHCPQNNKVQWHEDKTHAREREEACRKNVSKDPRIRAREIKERAALSNIKESSVPSSQIRMRKKLIDEFNGVDPTKYDAAYANLDRGNGKEKTSISPLDNLYTTDEALQKTGKGYGLQMFGIPKNDIDNRCNNQKKKLAKEEWRRKSKKRHDRKIDRKANKHEEKSVQLKRDINNAKKCDPRSAMKSLTADETSQSVENKENIMFKRLTDKYSSIIRKIGSHKYPLISIPPRDGSIMQPSSGSSNMQGHYAANNQLINRSNQMVHVNNQMVHHKVEMINQNKFIPSHHNSMNQNVTANRCENTYMNNVTLQNNFTKISHTQFKNPFNATPNAFHNKITPAKVFHPYDSIESSSEYDLSKMSPIDFYSPTYNQTERPLLSPPNYANSPPYSPPFPSEGQPPPYMDRQTFGHWQQNVKDQWQQEKSHTPEREVVCRQSTSRDPRIRALEIQERTAQSNIKDSPDPPARLQIRKKLIDKYSHTEYDAARVFVDREKGKEEPFISPLHNMYTTGEAIQRTEKSYGLEQSEIPKTKNVIDSIYHNEEKESKKETCKTIIQVIPQKVKDEVTGIILRPEKSVTPKNKEESKSEKEENTVLFTSTRY